MRKDKHGYEFSIINGSWWISGGKVYIHCEIKKNPHFLKGENKYIFWSGVELTNFFLPELERSSSKASTSSTVVRGNLNCVSSSSSFFLLSLSSFSTAPTILFTTLSSLRTSPISERHDTQSEIWHADHGMCINEGLCAQDADVQSNEMLNSSKCRRLDSYHQYRSEQLHSRLLLLQIIGVIRYSITANGGIICAKCRGVR